MGEEGRMGNQDREETSFAPGRSGSGKNSRSDMAVIHCHTESCLPQHTPGLIKAAENLKNLGTELILKSCLSKFNAIEFYC